MKNTNSGRGPLPRFTTISSIAVMVGIVVGIGIFRLPPIVAANSANELQFMLFWLAGGGISLLGALCYAELASSKPNAGGEYHFLKKAFGAPVSFLFSWGRMTVIQTGSIALIAFIMGDYASLIYSLGTYSSAVYAGLTIILLTGLNLMGTHHSRRLQNLFTATIILMIILLSISGLFSLPADSLPDLSGLTKQTLTGGSIGSAMIFVLLTYGGWNEAVYISGELVNVKQNMVKVLMIGICLITGLYLLTNFTYLYVLGFNVLQQSETVGADLTHKIFGSQGSLIVAIIVIMTALSTANATIITGARTNFALGRDFKLLRFLGIWNNSKNTPSNALIVQGIVALILVALGSWSQEAVSTMVDYTAPVFWFFIVLTTLTLFIFRYRHDTIHLPYRVPFYPLTPILFLLAAILMLYSSVVYTGFGALAGVGILSIGVPVYLIARRNR